MSEPLSAEGLFREHGAFVWRTLRRLGTSESDAEDLTQEVFVIVHRKLEEFEGRSSVTTWLYGICVRVAHGHRRKARVTREIVTDEVPDVEASAEESPHARLETAESIAWLDRALATLDEDKRAVFVLFEIEELPMQAVAEAVECPLQTAYSRLYAAREEVKSFLRKTSKQKAPWVGPGGAGAGDGGSSS